MSHPCLNTQESPYTVMIFGGKFIPLIRYLSSFELRNRKNSKLAWLCHYYYYKKKKKKCFVMKKFPEFILFCFWNILFYTSIAHLPLCIVRAQVYITHISISIYSRIPRIRIISADYVTLDSPIDISKMVVAVSLSHFSILFWIHKQNRATLFSLPFKVAAARTEWKNRKKSNK